MAELLMPLAAIVLDDRAQPREAIDQDVVNEYAEAMRAGAVFPALVAFGLRTHAYAADGWHRYYAAELLGHQHITVDLRPGGLEEAIWYAAGANAQHGLRRSSADKRRAIRMALALRPELSDRQIAEQCGVSHPTVSSVRATLEASGQIELVEHSVDTAGRHQPRRRDPDRMNSPVTVIRPDRSDPAPEPDARPFQPYRCDGCGTLIAADGHVCEGQAAPSQPQPSRAAEPSTPYTIDAPRGMPAMSPILDLEPEPVEPGESPAVWSQGSRPIAPTGSESRTPIAATRTSPAATYRAFMSMTQVPSVLDKTGVSPSDLAEQSQDPAADLAAHQRFMAWYRRFLDELTLRAGRSLSDGRHTAEQG